jgi:hypothetical protein
MSQFHDIPEDPNTATFEYLCIRSAYGRNQNYLKLSYCPLLGPLMY